MKTKINVLLVFVTLCSGAFAQHQLIENIAGVPGSPGYDGEFVNALDSEINAPLAIARDSEGNIYWTQLFANRIMKYDIVTEEISTYIGDGTAGSTADGTNRELTQTTLPGGICFDQDDNLYWTEAGDPSTIKVLHKDDDKTYKLVGNGTFSHGPSGGKGDTTGVGAPYGIAVDGAGNVYWTERTGYCIRKWSPIDSIVTTVAGTPLVSGTEITDINALTTPITVRGGIDVSLDGNRIYYASFDTYNVNEIYFDGSIRKIRTIAGTGVLGSGDLVGLGTTIALGTPFGVKIAPDGSVFFCEQTAGLVRRVDLTTGLISTIAGVQDNIVYNDNLLDPLLTTMGPLDVAFGEGDNIIISDNENHLIRRKFTCFNPDPTEIVISPDEYCVGDSITLKVVGNLNDGEEWYWLEGNCDIFAPVLDSGVVYETVAKPDISEYYAKGIGECTINEPCAGITIETSCLPYSNVFTPNGDGINEFFDLEIAKDYPSNYLYVYNRYGDEVFFTQDYDNEMVVWDGSSDATGGVVVPGTYYFVLYDLSSNTDVLSGWVEVIK